MVNDKLDDIFGSLADPTRRDILQRLLSGEMSINRLAKQYAISLPAVSKHLKVLEAAQLITRERRGRQHFIKLRAVNFQNATDHLLYYQAALDNRLDSLDLYMQGKMKAAKTPPPAKKRPLQTIRLTHIFNASIEKVWQVYTDPEHISKWWGPKGSTVVQCYNDLRVDGVWRFAFRGVENHDYVVSGQYQHVELYKKLVYTDGFGEAGHTRPEALVTITFEVLPDGKTKLTKESVAPQSVHQLQASWLKVAQADL